MSHAVEVNWYARDFVIMALLTACIVAGVVMTSVVPATAQSATSSPVGTAEPTPEQVKTLLQLLSDPVVKGWIAREMQAASAPQAQTPGLAAPEASVSGFVEWRLQVWQEHLRGLADALPGLSAEVGSAMARLWEEAHGPRARRDRSAAGRVHRPRLRCGMVVLLGHRSTSDRG